MKITGESEDNLPEYFVTSMDIDYRDRIEVQATWQNCIDASISSTVNVPESFTVEQIESLYMLAWEKGLKGITIYRDKCARTGILTIDTSEKKTEVNKSTTEQSITEQSITEQPITEATESKEVNKSIFKSESESESEYVIPKERLERAKGERVKINTGCGSMWLMVFEDENGNIAETFSQSGTTGGCQGLTEGLTRALSLLYRANVHPDYIIDQMKSVKCSVAVNAMKNQKCDGKSCPDIIARELVYQHQKRKNKDIGNKEVDTNKGANENANKDANKNVEKVIEQSVKQVTKQVTKQAVKQTVKQVDEKIICPDCNEKMNMQGCPVCLNCGYSKCS